MIVRSTPPGRILRKMGRQRLEIPTYGSTTRIAGRLNFRVRNENGCGPSAVTAVPIWVALFGLYKGFVMGYGQ